MEFKLSSIAVVLISGYLLLKLFSFIKLYINARRTGFPIYVSPVFSKSLAWMILGQALLPLYKKHLPEWIYERLDMVTHGWEFRRRAEMHRRLGRVFALVTPDECSLWVADPALSNVILQRRKDFIQSPIVALIIGIFGSNVLQSNGEDWQRQRRIIAPNLNERISESVWRESCQQAQTMLDYLVKDPSSQTLGGLRKIAINVIGQAGYGQNQPWMPEEHQEITDEPQDGRAAYFRTISLVTDMLVQAAFLPTRMMKMSFMPRSLQLLGHHKENMPRYTKTVLDAERKAAEQGSGPRNNVLSMLVRFSDEGKTSGSVGLSMTDDEISGNLFVFSTAGFDTTANTMGYAVILLTAYPEWQEWIRKELRDLDPDNLQWKYEDIFPKCQRTLALMLETLRLFTPVLHSTRAVAERQQLVDSDGTHLLIPPMDVYVSAQCIHSDPDVWGTDVLYFRPSRWIDSAGQMITPPKGTFLPWSGGPRVCPGMKMSQVEFVATMATLFRSARCEPVRIGQEKPEEVRGRLRNLMKDSVAKLTMQVRNPEEVKLRWIRDV